MWKEDIQIYEDRNTGLRFGQNEHILILGHNNDKGNKRQHYVECNICKQDKELNEDGIFLTFIQNVKNGSIPCNCSSKRKLTKEQVQLLCNRQGTLKDLTFVGLEIGFKNTKSRAEFECNLHGKFSSRISQVLSGKFGCLHCRKIKPENAHREEILTTGLFPDGTLFEPDTTKVNKDPQYTYWKVWCPTCEYTYSSLLNSLKKGKKGCGCSRDIREAYINLLRRDGEIIGIKFGIGRDVLKRIKQISSRTDLIIQNYCVFRFENAHLCSSAESECKKLLECRLVGSKDMPDGYTETTSYNNVERVKEIYKKYGGWDVTSEYEGRVKDFVEENIEIAKKKLDRLIDLCDDNFVLGSLNKIRTNPIFENKVML